MPKQRTAGELQRIQFDMAERSMARLKSLKERTGATSYAEVVRRALKFYLLCLEAEEQGGRAYFRCD